MFKTISIKAQLAFVVWFLALLLIIIGAVGMRGMSQASDSLRQAYYERLVPSTQVAEIDGLMRGSIQQLTLAAQHDPRLEESALHDHPITMHTDTVLRNVARMAEIWAAYGTNALAAEEATLAREFDRARDALVRNGLEAGVALYGRGDFQGANVLLMRTTNPAFAAAAAAGNRLMEFQRASAEAEYQAAIRAYERTRNLAVLAIVVGVLLAAVIGYFLAHGIVDRLHATIGFFQHIANGKLDNDIQIAREDEVGQLMHELRRMQARLKEDIDSTRQVANENLRIRNALDSVTANVMVADAEHNIIYLNGAVQKMFRAGAADLRKDLPHFDPDKLMGSSMDLFHRKPEHHRRLLGSLDRPYETTIRAGGRTYALVASPIINPQGERLGTAVQWTDRTAEVATEQEVEALVGAASRGDLSGRIELKGKDGFFKHLGEGINELMQVTERSLGEVATVLEAMAQGDLTHKVEGDFHGTFGKLRDDTNRTVETLNRLITGIKGSADTINTAAREIAAGNTNLSQRTEEQASSLEETASSMEELTSTVRQNADNARQANQLAHGASDVASKGGEKVREVVVTMNAITESSRKISDIISVIDGIAFQTNILALNAAVEAARAGEQGRGFAVVAGEVRTLAQRSAAAAKEIKTLINHSVETVEGGSKLVEQAGATMEEIVSAVKRVTDIMAEISAASDEQSQGIEQVSTAVAQMDEVTQQNAALVEQSAAAASSLEDQAHGLAEAVAVFRIDDAAAPARKPAASAARAKPAVAKAGSKPSPAKPATVAVPKPPKARDFVTGEEWAEF